MHADSPEAPVITRPRPAPPILVFLSSAVLSALTGAAASNRAFAFAACLAVMAVLPWARRDRTRTVSILLAYAGVAWCLFEMVRVPLGARVTSVFIPACVALVVHARILGLESVIRWTHPRWKRGISAPVQPLDQAFAAALGRARPAPAAIDAAVVALAAAPPSAIPEGAADRRAFLINAHNVIVAHAGRDRRSPHLLDAIEVLRTEYVVAGVPLTPYDIQLGLLRRGAPVPFAPWPWSYADDPRMRWATPLDPRVLFALSAGTFSFPRPRLYRGDTLDAELDAAAQIFLAAESEVDTTHGIIRVSPLLRWYARDFGGEKGVRALIARAVGMDEATLTALRLSYRSFEWTSSL